MILLSMWGAVLPAPDRDPGVRMMGWDERADRCDDGAGLRGEQGKSCHLVAVGVIITSPLSCPPSWHLYPANGIAVDTLSLPILLASMNYRLVKEEELAVQKIHSSSTSSSTPPPPSPPFSSWVTKNYY